MYPLGENLNGGKRKGGGKFPSPTFTFRFLKMGPFRINLPVFINAKISGVI